MKPNVIKFIVPWQAGQEISILSLFLGFPHLEDGYIIYLVQITIIINSIHILYFRARNNSEIEQSKFGHACHEEFFY